MTKMGTKEPHGIGRVMERADIQNYITNNSNAH